MLFFASHFVADGGEMRSASIKMKKYTSFPLENLCISVFFVPLQPNFRRKVL